MYKIGKITNTHGIKGEVKIFNMSDFNRFSVGKEIFILLKQEKVCFVIERVRTQKNILIVKFKGIDNINQIELYKGFDLYSDESVSNELEEDDYHYSELVDLAVYDQEDHLLGKVFSIIPVPQGHLLEIETINGKKSLVPFNKAFIENVLEDRIIIKPIEGTSMKIDIITIFPEFFDPFLETSIIKRAIEQDIVSIKAHQLRDYSKNKHKKVDDTPYGGGAVAYFES